MRRRLNLWLPKRKLTEKVMKFPWFHQACLKIWHINLNDFSNWVRKSRIAIPLGHYIENNIASILNLLLKETCPPKNHLRWKMEDEIVILHPTLNATIIYKQCTTSVLFLPLSKRSFHNSSTTTSKIKITQIGNAKNDRQVWSYLGAHAIKYWTTSHYPQELWLSKSLNTSSNLLTRVRY